MTTSAPSDLKTLLHLVARVTAVGLLARCYALVDQIFAAQIAPEYLSAHILINYIPFVAITLAIVFGYSFAVILPKATSARETSRLITGGLWAGGWLVTVMLALCIICQQSLLETLGLTALPGAARYLNLLCVAGLVLFLNTLFKYILISTRHSERVIVADVIGNCLNVAGNFAALRLSTEPGAQFAGLAYATLVSQVLILVIYLRYFLPQLAPDLLSSSRAYLTRATRLLLGEGWGMLLLVLIPISITALTHHFTSLQLVNAYNVAYQLNYFLGIPAIALGLSGASWLAEGRVVSADLYRKRLATLWQAVLWTCVLPPLALLPFLSPIAAYAFQLSGHEDLIILYVSLAALLLVNLGVPFQCILRSAEMPKVIAHVELLATFVIALPIFIYFLSEGRETLAFLSVILLPSVLKVGALSFATSKLTLPKAR